MTIPFARTISVFAIAYAVAAVFLVATLRADVANAVPDPVVDRGAVPVVKGSPTRNSHPGKPRHAMARTGV